jgi:hypothetical protein
MFCRHIIGSLHQSKNEKLDLRPNQPLNQNQEIATSLQCYSPTKTNQPLPSK